MDSTVRVLTLLARLTVGSPAAQLMIGYLMASPERILFVDRLEREAEAGMVFAAHRRIEVPMVPWQGFVRGVPIPDPLLWLDAVRDVRPGQVMVRISSDDAAVQAALTPFLSRTRARLERRDMEERMRELREEVDRTLDLYGEMRRLMNEESAGDSNLPRFLEMARQQMQELGEELSRVKDRLARES
jgi:hypothetical protein